MTYKCMMFHVGLFWHWIYLFIYFIKRVEAGLNPLGLNICVYADGWLYSVGEAQICVHSGYSQIWCLTHCELRQVLTFSSPSVMFLSQLTPTHCSPTALVFLDVPLAKIREFPCHVTAQHLCLLTFQVLIFTSTRIFTNKKWPSRKVDCLGLSVWNSSGLWGKSYLNTPCEWKVPTSNQSWQTNVLGYTSSFKPCPLRIISTMVMHRL